ncbi:MAG: Imm59 family immunity protein [Spirochaetales bacterium]|nr:Imm59 family immunity protein [Spirochaetales bacterium]
MTLNEVKGLVTQNDIGVFFDKDNPRSNGLCIYEENGKWYVFATDERWVKMGLREFENEDEACQSFLKRLEASRRLGWEY